MKLGKCVPAAIIWEHSCVFNELCVPDAVLCRTRADSERFYADKMNFDHLLIKSLKSKRKNFEIIIIQHFLQSLGRHFQDFGTV